MLLIVIQCLQNPYVFGYVVYIALHQGRTQNLMWVGSFQEKVDFSWCRCAKHTQHAKHAKAGGSGGMPPQENLKNRYQNTGFGDISAT